MALRIYNTLTRSLQEFQPLNPPAVSMYVCGPTVYDVPHIGHARSAYVFDVWRRYLAYRAFHVRFVRNVTDVDDKIIDKARRELAAGSSPPSAGALKATCAEVAARYLQRYHETMDRLGILRPDVEPKATEHVVPDPAHVEATKQIDASMTGFISQLITKNAAYPSGGDVYFSVRKFSGYGTLSNRTLDELQVGARVEPGEQKEDPLDFALWKAAKPEEPSWKSPWGPGRPGWHIECSVMSTAYLGDTFDIHGGGVDLVFPHHENELAQAQAIGKPFARYWIHNGLLTVDGEKMSKSLGNYLTLEQVLDAYPHPDYLKILFLKTHYRSPIDYAPAKMEEAKKNWEEFSWLLEHAEQSGVRPQPGATAERRVPETGTLFEEAMDDDLNTPKAMAVLFDIVRRGREALEEGTSDGSAIAKRCASELLNLGMVLGLFKQGMGVKAEEFDRIRPDIEEREAARKRKDYPSADAIRKKLEQEGYWLTDTPHGPLVRRRTR